VDAVAPGKMICSMRIVKHFQDILAYEIDSGGKKR
jgi:hypothetical protein